MISQRPIRIRVPTRKQLFAHGHLLEVKPVEAPLPALKEDAAHLPGQMEKRPELGVVIIDGARRGRGELPRNPERGAALREHAEHLGVLFVPQPPVLAVRVAQRIVDPRVQRNAGDAQDHAAASLHPVENAPEAGRPSPFRGLPTQDRPTQRALVERLHELHRVFQIEPIDRRLAFTSFEQRIEVEIGVVRRHAQEQLAVIVEQVEISDAVRRPVHRTEIDAAPRSGRIELETARRRTADISRCIASKMIWHGFRPPRTWLCSVRSSDD